VHRIDNYDVDLGGRNVLISEHFDYFGSRAKPLPVDLYRICHQSQGHRSNMNQPYFDRFNQWLSDLKLQPGQLYGWPDYVIDWQDSERSACQAWRKDDEQDREICG
jgi:hypothetical protein